MNVLVDERGILYDVVHDIKYALPSGFRSMTETEKNEAVAEGHRVIAEAILKKHRDLEEVRIMAMSEEYAGSDRYTMFEETESQKAERRKMEAADSYAENCYKNALKSGVSQELVERIKREGRYTHGSFYKYAHSLRRSIPEMIVLPHRRLQELHELFDLHSVQDMSLVDASFMDYRENITRSIERDRGVNAACAVLDVTFDSGITVRMGFISWICQYETVEYLSKFNESHKALRLEKYIDRCKRLAVPGYNPELSYTKILQEDFENV